MESGSRGESWRLLGCWDKNEKLKYNEQLQKLNLLPGRAICYSGFH
jgi:hypothetical protein